MPFFFQRESETDQIEYVSDTTDNPKWNNNSRVEAIDAKFDCPTNIYIEHSACAR